jgi:hypothetical protein
MSFEGKFITQPSPKKKIELKGMQCKPKIVSLGITPLSGGIVHRVHPSQDYFSSNLELDTTPYVIQFARMR